MTAPRVLVVHNRYRIAGGEERSVELQLRALRVAGIEHGLLERRSSDVGRVRAAAVLLRGGEREHELGAAARGLDANVVHVHNMQPLVGPRGLAAARAAGARVVLHLHNLRLFCAIGVAARDGGPCFRCHGRLTLPGLALNCRGSLPEAAAFAAALSLHQPRVFGSVDRFVAPSRWAVGQLALLGVPADRLELLAHGLPAAAFAERSRADRGGYVLVAARLAPEKGIDAAIDAAAATGVPLRIAGEGPAAADLAARAERLRAPVELLGRVDGDALAALLRGAAAVLVTSRYHEFSPFAALEAAAAGVPVIATRMGGLPELVGERSCVPPNGPAALAARLRALWDNPELRRSEGDELLRRARSRYSEERLVRDLVDLYARVRAGSASDGSIDEHASEASAAARVPR